MSGYRPAGNGRTMPVSSSVPMGRVVVVPVPIAVMAVVPIAIVVPVPIAGVMVSPPGIAMPCVPMSVIPIPGVTPPVIVPVEVSPASVISEAEMGARIVPGDGPGEFRVIAEQEFGIHSHIGTGREPPVASSQGIDIPVERKGELQGDFVSVSKRSKPFRIPVHDAYALFQVALGAVESSQPVAVAIGHGDYVYRPRIIQCGVVDLLLGCKRIAVLIGG